MVLDQKSSKGQLEVLIHSLNTAKVKYPSEVAARKTHFL